MATRNPKGQHFLLSSASKDLSVIELSMMSDEECHDMFAKIRWSDTDGIPTCPTCGSVDDYWFLPSTSRYKCKSCKKQFSVTSDTIFADRKMSLKHYLVAIFLFANKVKGSSMVELARTLKVNYKTMFLLSHKIRASIIDTQDEDQFDGVCEIDAVHTNMYIRPKNNINDRIDRRKAEKPNKRAVVVTRLRADVNSGMVGAVKTKTDITIGETAKDMEYIALKNVKAGSQIHTDEADAFKPLHKTFDRKVVNHSWEYSSEEGYNNNQAESFNARFRRMVLGQHHHISTLYLSNYAAEVAYREDTRRFTNGDIFKDLVDRCLRTLPHNEWRGYHQGNHRVAERLISA
ncbi:MAG: IS1595 family transposase [Arcobacteraceae bacterium]|nr:IS1595 family transposase [Arcobacteraceae bacterium]